LMILLGDVLPAAVLELAERIRINHIRNRRHELSFPRSRQRTDQPQVEAETRSQLSGFRLAPTSVGLAE
jgi:hypothetical protein